MPPGASAAHYGFKLCMLAHQNSRWGGVAHASISSFTSQYSVRSIFLAVVDVWLSLRRRSARKPVMRRKSVRNPVVKVNALLTAVIPGKA
jgi:hypothetical protein